MSALPLRSVARSRRGLLGLFRKEPQPERCAVAPEGQRLYAIGDIHGRADQLERLLDRLEADAKPAEEEPCFVFLGDYVDRGPEVQRTLDILCRLPERFQRLIFLKGNHEEALLTFLDLGVGLEPWLAHGGEATLMSYGVARPRGGFAAGDAEELREELREKLPQEHLTFLRNLEMSYRCGELFFVHAGVRPGVPLEAQLAEDLLWIREPFLSSQEDYGAVIVHGHSITQLPEQRPNRIGVDTGAYATGVLTAAVITPRELFFLSSAP